VADLSITDTNVLPTSTTEYVDQAGVAGASISAGEMVYKNSSGVYVKAQNDVLADLNTTGMSMNTVVSGQPMSVAKGRITIGSAFTQGMQVNLSANPGKLAPVADISTNYVVACGCLISATDIFIFIKNFGIQHA